MFYHNILYCLRLDHMLKYILMFIGMIPNMRHVMFNLIKPEQKLCVSACNTSVPNFVLN